MNYFRPLYAILCFASALVFPYWITLFLSLVGYVLFDWYIEGILAVVLTDIVFGTPLLRFHHFVMVGTLISVALFIIVELGKRFTRYGNS